MLGGIDIKTTHIQATLEAALAKNSETPKEQSKKQSKKIKSSKK